MHAYRSKNWLGRDIIIESTSEITVLLTVYVELWLHIT
jgi:hypothetical protein